MSSKPDVAVLWGKLAWHPAVAAWREIMPDAPDPEQIEVLWQRHKSTTYRLVGAGPDGGTIIAQRSQTVKAEIERAVYEQILPHLPIRTARYYGSRTESPEWAWLFLEDVGDEPYSATDSAHLALAARWMGVMHTAGAVIPAARGLPDAGPARYLDHLRVGREAVRACLKNPVLAVDELATIRQLLSDLDLLERRWACIERACTGVSSTFVHGDFRPKNAHIRHTRGQAELLVIDWEMAGWGVPAVDLAEIDLPTYWSVVRSEWPGARLEDMQRLRAVGQVFRSLAAVRWMAAGLLYDRAEWLIRPVMTMQQAQRSFVDAFQAIGVAT
jgi:phosphotransferase family enzyme